MQSAKALLPGTAKARRGGHDWRLHRHADYQRVYQASRKQFASLLTYFVAPQLPGRMDLGPHGPADLHPGLRMTPRVGITAGKVLGKAVERNRIKRRMRAAITGNLDALPGGVDVVLHPKRAVLTADWITLRNEVRRIFVKIEETQARSAPMQTNTAQASPKQELPESQSRERRLPEEKS
ncbi:MAG: ribonuclease P protein component [Acidobacteriaceae bacterium]